MSGYPWFESQRCAFRQGCTCIYCQESSYLATVQKLIAAARGAIELGTRSERFDAI